MAFDPSMLDLTTRSTLTEEERKERRRAASRLAMESRRQAVTELITRHRDEYEELYNRANLSLRADPKYRI